MGVCLIAKCGPGATLLTPARRARCGGCGRRSCHVQPAEPPAPGTPHYREWLRGEMEDELVTDQRVGRGLDQRAPLI